MSSASTASNHKRHMVSPETERNAPNGPRIHHVPCAHDRSHGPATAGVDPRNANLEFERDVLKGLRGAAKTLPCKYFYDKRGSELFERICKTPEYYVTRTELRLLRRACPEVAALVGPSVDILEPGSGAGEKIRILLDALERPRTFIPIDISESAVGRAARSLKRDYPELSITPLVADFTRPFQLPEPFARRSPHRKMVFFPGSTISNFAPSEASTFLSTQREVLRSGDYLFIGVDRVKDHEILERAYNDAQGFTAAFNLNLLVRIRSTLDTDLDPGHFTHRAYYNASACRIEMHLESRIAHVVRIGGERISFRKRETIHTENSYKYEIPVFVDLATRSGYRVVRVFSDEDQFFSLYLCEVP